MEKTWKPTVAGILSIVAGAFGIIVGIAIAALGSVGGGPVGALGWPFVGGLVVTATAVLLALSAVAIAGGVVALKRRVWGLALAGAICALLLPPPFILGVLAIVFVTIGKDEFK
ncbi:MAG: hypothetical protein J7L19_03445 [Dehalococcoidia bacterium]|nr:hypothetical protein [Dehalococcoidia bacterium]